MDLHTWFVYLAAAIGLSLTPGPNGLLALSHGMRFGLGRATWTALWLALAYMGTMALLYLFAPDLFLMGHAAGTPPEDFGGAFACLDKA